MQWQAAKFLRNAWSLVSLPIWQINEPGTAKSVQWVDWPSNPRFAVWGDDFPEGLVLDKTTGLVWTRNVDIAGRMNWHDARDFCLKHAAGDIQGFRLPSLPEISTLFGAGGSLPIGSHDNLWVNTPADPADGFWTSTPAEQRPDTLFLDEKKAVLSSLDDWTYASSQSGAFESDYLYAPAGSGTRTVTWELDFAEAGSYDVYAFVPKWWDPDVSAATNAKYTINYDGGSTPDIVDQTIDGGKWRHLGQYPFAAGTTYVTLSDDAGGTVMADAIRVTPAGMPPVMIGDPWGDGTNFRIYSIKNVFQDPGGELAHDIHGGELRRVWAVRGLE
jgi:hypothetical protein